MKLAVFGGAGKAGRLLVVRALHAGHDVIVLVRTPQRLAIEHERLRVVTGDALDPSKVARTLEGADVIVSLLGPAKDAPPRAVSLATANIVNSARRCGVRRLLVAAGAGVGDPADRPRASDKLLHFLLTTAVTDAYEDMMATARVVRSSDLDWTLVRIPRLSDAPASHKPKVGALGKGAGWSLSRADLAEFMLREAANPTYIRQSPVVSD